MNKRKNLRELVNNEFRKLEANPAQLETMDSYYQQAYTMLSSEKVKCLYMSKETDAMKDRYGMGKFLERGHYGASLRFTGRWSNAACPQTGQVQGLFH